MPVTSRAFRNVARGRARTIAVVAMVGIALALFLILTQIDSTISARVAEVRSALKDVIIVQRAGSGFSLSTYVNSSIVKTVRGVSGVASAQRILLHLPDLGSGSGPPSNFTLYEGIDTGSNITLFGGLVGSTGLTVTSGRMLDPADENTSNAVVGSSFASDHDLSVGSTISVNGTSAGVVGVFTTGASFSDESVILPYPFAATAFDAPGPNLLYVVVRSGASVDTVAANIRSAIGSAYDVTPGGQLGGGFGNALNTILSSTQFEAYAALGVGGAVMVITTGLVMSRRTKEIGLLKAFGFPNGTIVRQLSLEGLLLALFGLPIGLLASVWLGPTVAELIAGSGPGGRGPGAGRFAGGFVGTLSFAITPTELVLGVVVTVGFGLAGSLYPMVRALRLKPAEALRHE